MGEYGYQAKNCRGGVGSSLSPTERGLPLPPNAVRHIYLNSPKALLAPKSIDLVHYSPVASTQPFTGADRGR
jgi:hypothetical protein